MRTTICNRTLLATFGKEQRKGELSMSKIYLENFHCQPRRDTSARLQANNPVLCDGEMGVVTDGTDTEWLKVGDGVTPWNQLPYKKGPKGDKGNKGDKGERGEPAITDQTYSATSENAQSGKAVAELEKTLSEKTDYKTLPVLTELIIGDQSKNADGVYLLKAGSPVRYVNFQIKDTTVKKVTKTEQCDADITVIGDAIVSLCTVSTQFKGTPLENGAYMSGGVADKTTCCITAAKYGVDNEKAAPILCVEQKITKILNAVGYVGGSVVAHHFYHTDYSLKVQDYASTDYVDNKIGDIDEALDNIIALQNSYIGGDS